MNTLVRLLKKVVPEAVVELFRPLYHSALSFGMALAYGFPARRLVVIGVTGTKGKSTVCEMLYAILREAGFKTALLSTIRFVIDGRDEPNLYKMTLPGRGFAQAFMRRAVRAGCTHLVIELTSEAQLQRRTENLCLDGLVVTNIQREHIERHGSFEKYVEAKRRVVEELERSPKTVRALVANADIAETAGFLSASVTAAIPFRAQEARELTTADRHTSFVYEGTPFTIPLPGAFNAANALAAIKLAEAFGVSRETAADALAHLPPVRGRVEHIDAGQGFLTVVDYAHTPDSLRALYSAFPHRHKICVLGNTGGGRDRWKRPEMGRIAEAACETVILTNEDPYDEDPRSILEEMAAGMERAPEIILDRREAIRQALQIALRKSKGGFPVAVLISGKGTDPFIMGPGGSKTPWSDAQVTREELEKLVAGSR